MVIFEKYKLIKSNDQSLMLVKFSSKSIPTRVYHQWWRKWQKHTWPVYPIIQKHSKFYFSWLGITVNDKPNLSENKMLISILKLFSITLFCNSESKLLYCKWFIFRGRLFFIRAHVFAIYSQILDNFGFPWSIW